MTLLALIIDAERRWGKVGCLNLHVFRLLPRRLYVRSLPMEFQGVTHLNVEVGVIHVRRSDLNDLCVAHGQDSRGRHASKQGFHNGAHL